MSAHGCVLSVERLSALGKIWHRLFADARNPSPFVSYEWFSVLGRHILLSDPEVMLCRSNGKVVGVLPAAIQDSTLKFIGDERVTDLSGMVCATGYEEEVVGAVADFIKSRDLKVDLFPVEEDSILAGCLRKKLPELSVKKKDVCPLLHLPNTYDEYLKGLDGKSRHELRRKMRRINGTAVEDVKTKSIVSLFELMAASDDSKKRFLTPVIMSFFRDLACNFERLGWLRMRALYFNGRTIGIVFAFSLKERVYLYNMGFDPEYRRMSPGIMTIALDIQSAISEGYGYYDFLRGDEDYKYRFGAKERYTLRITR
ncbi:MAG: GNAT family N-acetyltransferase [candidate division WOR-3 bacterium]|nr:MAG: GNAT family N-acetyltransferase [candidate division WOR-3 bacterium]